MTARRLHLIVAYALNADAEAREAGDGRRYVIGRDGGIPWHLPEDLRRFKALTMSHAVIMGRRTWESLPDRARPLPGRRNIVLTRAALEPVDICGTFAGAFAMHSLEEALRLAWESDADPFVIGGAAVYAAAFPYATDLHITYVHAPHTGDTFLPPLVVPTKADWDAAGVAEGQSSDGAAFWHFVRRGEPAALESVGNQTTKEAPESAGRTA